MNSGLRITIGCVRKVKDSPLVEGYVSEESISEAAWEMIQDLEGMLKAEVDSEPEVRYPWFVRKEEK